jgi:hypothetical protein
VTQEDFMRILSLAAGVAVLCTTISASSAFADSGSLSGCLDKEHQVKAALAANQQSPNYAAADKEQNYGLQFCTNNFYQQGIDHYNRALALLGTTPSKG